MIPPRRLRYTWTGPGAELIRRGSLLVSQHARTRKPTGTVYRILRVTSRREDGPRTVLGLIVVRCIDVERALRLSPRGVFPLVWDRRRRQRATTRVERV